MKPLVLCAVALLSSAAQAGVAGETPRQMFFEAKLGPYVPLIDRGFATGLGPYHRIFNTEAMILGEGVLEYQFFQAFGTAAGALSAGYAEKYAPALGPSGELLTQKTGLKLVPLKAYLSYRFDLPSERWSIPFVPYVKAGLAMVYWSVVNGDAVELAEGANGSDVRGAGVKYGFLGTLGLSMQLDFLDQRLSRDFDTSMGVNHTYLFAEYALQEITNFGTAKSTDLDLSSRHWMFGLAFEF